MRVPSSLVTIGSCNFGSAECLCLRQAPPSSSWLCHLRTFFHEPHHTPHPTHTQPHHTTPHHTHHTPHPTPHTHTKQHTPHTTHTTTTTPHHTTPHHTTSTPHPTPHHTTPHTPHPTPHTHTPHTTQHTPHTPHTTFMIVHDKLLIAFGDESVKLPLPRKAAGAQIAQSLREKVTHKHFTGYPCVVVGMSIFEILFTSITCVASLVPTAG